LIIKALNGNSGCQVLLCQKKESKQKYIRKISSGKEYNDRLYSQMLKQSNFNSSNVKVKTPDIISNGYIGEYFYFDMEYIQGKLLSECINDLDHITISPYIKMTSNYLLEIQNKDVCYKDSSHNIHSKLKTLSSVIDKKYTKYLNLIKDTDWALTPISKCHGDFTLENLIISNGNLYLIDFLDSFLESPLVDVAKLLFDLRYFWSKRRLRTDSKSIIKNIHMESVIANSEVYATHKKKINSLLILSILRILPYTRNQQKILYLEECLIHASRS
jgi:hypothetical protein